LFIFKAVFMFRTYLQDFMSLLFPETCNACLKPLINGEKVLCTECSYYLPVTGFHLEADNPVSRLFWGRVEVDSAATYYSFQKGSRVQHLIHRLKYKGVTEIGFEIGKRYGADLKQSELFREISLILPVPLHDRKLKKRGFNQSDYFAAGLAHSMGIPWSSSVLKRVNATETQTRKSRFNRWKNVESVFAVSDSAMLSGKHVLLVDDVVTTGATLEACAHALLEVDGVKVSIVTMAAASG